MDISVIIVNYNVKFFLEQCLASLQSALSSLTYEILVVDNNSSDGSVDYLQKKFPEVNFICNKSNEGFAKANNMALSKSQGEFILFLNPDTILSEDSITGTIQFLKQDSSFAATGIRMIDGGGKYLKESKRGYPSVWAAFCKMCGLTSLFPRSSVFAKYYLGHLPSNQNQKVEALSGAFMLIKKEVLDIIGGFDERFFMYAEDIDLSYRIQKAGYSNHYFADSTIVHFKGESTTKNAAYTKRFYKAMIQFVQKHHTGALSFLSVSLLEVAIKLKTGLALLSNKPKSESKGFPRQFELRGVVGSELDLLSSELKTDGSEPNAVVFCIGTGFSYKDAIKQLDSTTESRQFYFHGPNTFSIAGSSSKDEKGQSFAIDQSLKSSL